MPAAFTSPVNYSRSLLAGNLAGELERRGPRQAVTGGDVGWRQPPLKRRLRCAPLVGQPEPLLKVSQLVARDPLAHTIPSLLTENGSTIALLE